MQMLAYFNPVAALRRLSFSGDTARDDLIAGITVSLIAIPQSLAYAQLAGVPAYYGLYAALIPTIVGALFGSSRQLSTGPVAMTSLLTAASVAPFAAQGTDMFYTYVVLLALISGVLQILFGLLRMGMLLNFLSHPVLIGFINAAALIIGLSQLPALLGVPARQSDQFLVDVWGVLGDAPTMHEISFVLGAVALVALYAFKRFAPKWPGVLVTVAALTGVSYLIGYADMDGSVVGAIPQGLPTLSVPQVEWQAVQALLPAGFIIALISFMEAMSSSKVIAIKTRAQWDQNQELVGQGLAKIAAAFCHTLPVSGSFSRSALNLASNARSGLASIISAGFVLLTLLFLTPLLFHLPKPVLAAIIMMAVFGLLNFRNFVKAWRANRDDGIAAVVTFVATLVFAPNIQNGILTGILVSLAMLLYRMMKPRIAILGKHHDASLRDAGRHQDIEPMHPQLSALRFDGALRFVNVACFEDALLKLERENPELKHVLVKSSGINYIDASGVEMLGNLADRFRESGITLNFSGFKSQVQDVLDRTGLAEKIGRDHIFPSDGEALTYLNQTLGMGPAK
ncbi:MAG: sodium-independent anion transporter [Hydrogenophilales bacterium 12-61-10]|nr:MAG: sodium-independent anion transporter [Hydrogenophilales bacterium 12-61-10]OYX33186.1 MAG: sodium-independent anion transporter [Hydrogenophilales bacterium 32-62-9]